MSDNGSMPASKVRRRFISLLRAAGYRKVAWSKCPQGFKESGYPCYSHKDKNVWIEVYLTDDIPYGHIQSPIHKPRGVFFDDIKTLEHLLTELTKTP